MICKRKEKTLDINRCVGVHHIIYRVLLIASLIQYFYQFMTCCEVLESVSLYNCLNQGIFRNTECNKNITAPFCLTRLPFDHISKKNR